MKGKTACCNKVSVQKGPIMENVPLTQKMQGWTEKNVRAEVQNQMKRDGELLHFMTPKQ